MIYREISPPARFPSAPAGTVAMQFEIPVCRDDGEKFAVAIYPQENSATWYFLTPTGDVWVNGLDGKTSVRDCISLFDTNDAAMSELKKTFRRFSSSNRGGIFETLLDDEGSLILRLKDEFFVE